MRTITRPLGAHAYGPEPARAGGAGVPVAHVHVHEASPKMPDPGVTPLNSPHAPLYAADGAPFYNSGYVYPQHGPLLTGGFPALRLPPLAGMLDLTDTTTWDRPVWFGDAH